MRTGFNYRKGFGIGLIILVATTTLLTGCLEEIGDLDKVADVRLTPEIATPVASSTFGINDFLESINSAGITNNNTDGFVTLTYGEDLFSESAEELFTIQDQFFTEILQVPGEFITPFPVTAEIPINVGYVDEFVPDNDERFDSLTIKTGSLTIGLTNFFNATGNLDMTIFSLQRDGEPLVIPFQWTFDGTSPNIVTSTVDLTGYTVVLSSGGGTFNQFGYNLEGTLSFDNQVISISESISTEIRLENVSFGGVFGYLGQRRVAAEEDSLRLDIFENITSGAFLVDDPRVRFTFDNSFGIAAAIDFNTFVARNNAQTIVELEGSIVDDLQVIDQPVSPGQSATSVISIDRSNSNFNELVSILPELIVYELDGLIGGTDVNVRSFALDTSRIDVSYEIELPLNFSLQDLFVSNTYNFNGDDFNDVVELTFFIDSENGFPFELGLQTYFLDAQGNRIDSLFTPENSVILSAAPTNSEGIVTEPASNSISIVLDESRAANLIAASELQIDARVQTTGTDLVKILDTYLIDLKIGVASELDLSTASGN